MTKQGGGVAAVDGLMKPEQLAEAVIDGFKREEFLILPQRKRIKSSLLFMPPGALFAEKFYPYFRNKPGTGGGIFFLSRMTRKMSRKDIQ